MKITYRYNSKVDKIGSIIKSHVLEIGKASFNEKTVDDLLYETFEFLSDEQKSAIKNLSVTQLGGEIDENGIIKKFI